MAKQKEEILFKWTCPREVLVAAAKVHLRRSKVFIPRVLFVIVIFWTGLYFALHYLLPPDSGINLGRIFIRGFVGVAVLLAFPYFWIIFETLFSRIKYQITPERVRVIGSSRGDIKWKDIIGYKVCKYEELEGFSGVRFFDHKGRFYESICLPQDERGDQIVRYIAERVPLLEKLPPSLEIIKLTMWQKVWLCIITVIYSLGASVSFGFYGHKWFGVIWTVLILGPGTIYLAFIYRRLFLSNKSLQRYALGFNLVSGILIILLTIWLMLWQMKREYGW
jgi:hypothetical protein